MKDVDSLVLVIEKIIDLLVSAEEDNWVAAFKKFKLECDSSNEGDLSFLCGEILRIYGGMESFNDLVLYREGRLMLRENRELDGFRVELFRILHEKR